MNCDRCKKPIEGPPFGGMGENVCPACWWEEDALMEDLTKNLAPGMRFDGDLRGFWAYNEKREPKWTLPEEHEQLMFISDAVLALKKLGWNDACYCPKDGTRFLAIEAGCTAVYPCSYQGEWPKGTWWVYHAGDVWPARPILWKPMPEHPVAPAEIQEPQAALLPEGAA